MNNRMKAGAAVLIIGFVASSFAARLAAENSYRLLSPDQRTTVEIRVQDRLSFSILHNNLELLAPSAIAMKLAGRSELGVEARVKAARTRFVQEEIKPVLPEKRKIIPDICNELELTFSGNYGVRFRAYDDGVAYRFFTNLSGNITIQHEELRLNFAANDSIYFPEEDSYLSHSERLYEFLAIKDIADSQMCSLPALVVKANGMKLAISEADLLDYAGLYLHGSDDGQPVLKSQFPPYPLKEKLEQGRDMYVMKAADYVAQTSGRRSFPWRVFGIAAQDGDLITNDIIYRLGSPLALKDTDWIKPGKVAWDWWNANNVYGVDFKSGINTATYKYYIDFASRHGIDCIILDEGWTAPADLFQINPAIDIDELFAYAKEKNVGIIPWMLWNALDKDLERALAQFEKWGAKGIKVDFMQRDDQKMVNYYEKVAKAAAAHHLLVDFHGAYKPTGLRRAYPNVLTREGVRGLEWNKWSKDVTPKHDVTLPFIRMFAGPMDYTPGAMINATADDFREVFNRPMSQGTRCHQLAMYVIFESPLQMLADSPSHYLEEPECMEFLSAVPTVWDETRVLDAKVGEYLTVARKNGETWYIGSMTNWNPRDFELDLSFVGAGTYKITFWADGLNADRYASDFVMQTKPAVNKDTIKTHLAPGGGWVAILAPEKR